jgi:ubiquinone/menaquinone biosynthesis C-methylase UbiE
MARSDNYVLSGGDRGAQRLKLLAQTMWPTTKGLFHRLKVGQGLSCLDLGCGIGSVTLKLARLVGSTGQVLGIDRDDRCLELAREEALRQKLNAIFQAKDAGKLQEENVYDIAYSRFLLSHLPDPADAIKRLVRATRPGGLVVVEDIEFRAHFCYPACPAFDRYVSLYQQAVHRLGGDPNIGPRLVNLLMDAGQEEVGVEVVQPTFRQGTGKRIAQVTMEHIQEAVVGAGFVSTAEVGSIIAELNQFARDTRTLLSVPRIFQVWGRKCHT